MEEPTDEDFLAILKDPNIWELATQPVPGSGADYHAKRQMKFEPMSEIASEESNPKLHGAPLVKSEAKIEAPLLTSITTTPEPKHNHTPTKASDFLNREELLAAQRRRQATIADINRSLERWKPTLRETFEDAATAEPGKENHSPATITKNDLDKLKRSASWTTKRVLETRWRAGERVQALITKDLDCARVEISSPDEQFKPDRYQEEAINAAKEGKNFFLTGSAGTGKSFVVKAIIRELRANGKEVAVTASTGCAAVGIGGGTIHSLSGVGLGMDTIERLRRKGRTDERLRKRFLNLHTLVIDEISMIDTFLFDKIEAVVYAARCPPPERRKQDGPGARSHAGRSIRGTGAPFKDAPFGGLQVIVCGDFFQLPPVGASDYNFRNSPDKFFAFDSQAWKNTIKSTFVLRVVHRQSDRKFVGLLNELRQGLVSDYTKQVLNACLVNPYKMLVEADEDGKRVNFTKLFSYRRQVASENSTQLKKLKSRGIRYAASDTLYRSEFGTLTAAIVQQMVENVNCPESVELRQGCRVLCLKNLDTERGIVNGTPGFVVGWSRSLEDIYRKRKVADPDLQKADLDPYSIHDDDVMQYEHSEVRQLCQGRLRDGNDCPLFTGSDMGRVLPVVRFDNGALRLMECETWEVHGLQGQTVAERRQVPLMLGWALSIHKAQGMTLGDVETDVAGAFDFGQVYVALSRATTVHRLRLKSYNPKKVVTHYKVSRFYKELENKAQSPRKRLSCGCAVGQCAGTCYDKS